MNEKEQENRKDESLGVFVTLMFLSYFFACIIAAVMIFGG